ncbi:hypothetical protein [Micromonospora maritima]|uniref:hypothetical protein n=1 Tax=Micromonospora maritima TaxID=986711 RepID=UPI00157CC87A|nr:hypothetical protein [Micromonospora maritima]
MKLAFEWDVAEQHRLEIELDDLFDWLVREGVLDEDAPRTLETLREVYEESNEIEQLLWISQGKDTVVRHGVRELTSHPFEVREPRAEHPHDYGDYSDVN